MKYTTIPLIPYSIKSISARTSEAWTTLRLYHDFSAFQNCIEKKVSYFYLKITVILCGRIDCAHFWNMKFLPDPDSGNFRFNTAYFPPIQCQGRYVGFLWKNHFPGVFHTRNWLDAFLKHENFARPWIMRFSLLYTYALPESGRHFHVSAMRSIDSLYMRVIDF
jgi:hypothetical protein